MKIVVLGTRGIPEVQGGVETVCQELYPRIASHGHDVTLICRAPYVKDKGITEYRGVKLVSLYAPKKKSLEAIVHTFLAVLKARRLRPDIVHFHAVGPSVMIPLARILGLKVIMTNHGPDYEREKWGRLARLVLKTGEMLSARLSSRIISISPVITRSLKMKYGCGNKIVEIPNGVHVSENTVDKNVLEYHGLEVGKYVVALGRLVPEKGFHDLIAAYKAIRSTSDFKIVIAGDADHADDYSQQLKRTAAETPGVVMTGFIRGAELHTIMACAGLFVMPSYHEGLPVAMLEAMSYGLDVLCSDIPACMIPELNADDHFPTGDIKALADGLQRKMLHAGHRQYNLKRYNWDTIAIETVQVYESALKDNDK